MLKDAREWKTFAKPNRRAGSEMRQVSFFFAQETFMIGRKLKNIMFQYLAFRRALR